MATLVAPLISGFSDAASGTVEFYTRNTSTLSTQVYSDVNGQTAVTTHVLDSRGRITRYVEEIVDVVVKNASGATVASWTEVVDARTVRLESAAFTGSNPNGNGQVIAAGMTSLHSGLALYAESLGTDDGYVDINGTEYTIQAALATSAGVFFNVRTGYGAQGNGTTDDTSAIQSAINAAITAGSGIVYFPAGTYKITSAISVPSSTTISIHFMGASPGNTKLVMHTTGITGWLVNDAAGFSCENLRFEGSATTHTGTILVSTKAAIFINCVFRGIAGIHATLSVDATVKQVNTFIGCAFWLENSSGRFVTGTAGTGQIKASFQSCMFTVESTASGAIASSLFGTLVAAFTNCIFEINLTSGSAALFTGGIFTLGASRFSPNMSGGVTITLIGASAATTVIMSGCTMPGTSGTLNIFEAGQAASSNTFHESGCQISWGTGIAYGGPSSMPGSWSSTSRESTRVLTTGFAGGNYTPDLTYGIHEIVQTAGAALAVQNQAPSLVSVWGAWLVFVYRNASGGALTPTWANQYSGVPATAVANNNTALYVFKRVSPTAMNAGDGEWICVTTNPVVAAA